METTTATPIELPVTILRPARGWSAIHFGDLWLYRELVYFLTWRDIKVRYKQAALGVAWAVIQPLVTVLVFTFVFGNKANLPVPGPIGYYPLLTMSGLLPWQLFSQALTRSSNSLVHNSNLLTKVYFPRLILPFSSVMAGLVDFSVSFLILLAMMLYYGKWPTWSILWLIPLTLLTVLASLAVGLWLSALNVNYRDVQQAMPFLVTTWMYASPVAYAGDLITGRFSQIVYALNPMAGIIQGYRWALFGGDPPGTLFLISLGVVALLFVTGLFYFKRMERTFADMV